MSRICPEPADANADCANASCGAQGPAAAARVGIEAFVWAGDVFMHF